MNWNNLQPLIIAYGINIISAILVFIIGKWLAQKITDLFGTALEKHNVEITLIKFLKNIAYFALIVGVLLAAAGQLGISTTSFLTIVGAASLAIGLALKDSLGNFAAGVMLILFRPFKVGDVITAGGETGKVAEITIFNTIMNTPDNQRKIVPNGAIGNSTITNINANSTRRVDLMIGIGYDDDIKKAKETLAAIIKADSRVLADPTPTIAVANLGDSSVDLAVRPWVKTGDYWDVLFDLTEQIKLTFDEEAISFPYPQQDVHMYNESN